MNVYLMIASLAVLTFLVLAASLPNQVYKGNNRAFVAATLLFCFLTLGVLLMFTKI